MILTVAFAALTAVSVGLLVWQLIAALRFPLHQRNADHSFPPAITILKPLKSCDGNTPMCLRSWFQQDYTAPVQLLFGVADSADPVCALVRQLIAEFPGKDARLIVCGESRGANSKVSTLAQLMRHARHEVVCVSDADVRVPQDFLAETAAALQREGAGLVNCFYQIANASTLAMRIEAISVNADFWSQVLQSNTLKRQAFALGAVMLVTRRQLDAVGGFDALANHLADDFQLGRKIANRGAQIVLAPLVVECWESPKGLRDVWRHQLRWARTIRVSQPAGYFFSLLGNVTLWSVLLAIAGAGSAGFIPLFGMTDTGRIYLPLLSEAAASESRYVLLTGYDAAFASAVAAVLFRSIVAGFLAYRLTRRRTDFNLALLVPVRDLLQAALWVAAFLGNTVVWGGRKFRVGRDGRLQPVSS